MTIDKLRAKHTELINQLDQSSISWKATRYILNTTAQISDKKQLIRNLETDAHYAQSEFKYVLLNAVYDLKH